MTASNPVFVIIPGAWHPPSCYSALRLHLEAANFTTIIPKVPSLNSSQPLTATCTQDAEAIRNEVLLPLIENQGRDVVLVAHSYGGVPGGGAAYGLSKPARAQEGKAGGIIGLVYIAAFIVPEGGSVVDYFGGSHAPFILLDEPSPGLSKPNSPISLWYNDIDEETALALEKSLLPHAYHAFESPVPPQAWNEPELNGRLAFLRCTGNKGLSVNFQNMLMEKSQVKWLVRDIESGHSPFVSRPKETAEFLVEWANRCLSVGHYVFG